MSSRHEPLVSVVTPVYNGGKYLRECIESVIGQTYTNWRYTIVNNRSTDNTLEIARHYANVDSRVHVYDNAEFLPIIDNHNRAFSLIEADSVYCKPLMADDRLYPNCLEMMVACGLMQPSIGLVCCLALTGEDQVLYDQLGAGDSRSGPATTILTGSAACRIPLLEDRHFFGSPTSGLIRADLIRKRKPFYDPLNVHADAQSCYDILRESDFAFIHRALVFIRRHEESQTSLMVVLESMRAGRFYTLTKYGHAYLNDEEFRQCYRQRLTQYYGMLAVAAVELRGRPFWEFHARMLSHSGAPLNRTRLAYAITSHVVRRLASPRSFARGVVRLLKTAMRNRRGSQDSSVSHH